MAIDEQRRTALPRLLATVGCFLVAIGFVVLWNPERLIRLDDHWYVGPLLAACGCVLTARWALTRTRPSSLDHTRLFVVLGILAVGLSRFTAAAISPRTGSSLYDISLNVVVTDEMGHSIVRHEGTDSETSSVCAQYELRTGSGFFDRHRYLQRCDPQIADASPSFDHGALVLTFHDAASCRFAVNWAALILTRLSGGERCSRLS